MKKTAKITLGLIIAIPLALFIFTFIQKNKKADTSDQANPDTVNENVEETFESYVAYFEITTKGTKRTFDNPMYHNLSEDVYITATNPNTIHIQKDNILWKDFFKTLPFELNKDCLVTGTKQVFCTGKEGTLKFLINNKEDRDALERKIEKNDKLQVVFQ